MSLLQRGFAEHNPFALLVLAWLLTIPLYVVLQVWFGYAWRGRWRIAALAPLFGVAVAIALVMVGALRVPDGPPIRLSDVLLLVPADGVALFAPLGFIYLVIAGIVHRARARSTKT